MKVDELLKHNKPVVKNTKYSITKIKEKQDGVILYLDNKEKISVSVEKYFEYGLSSLKGLDQKLYDQLKKEERLFLGYQSCLRKLSIKDFSNKQISDFLKIKKELNQTEIKQIIDKLISFGLLDDDRYCLNRTNYLNKQLLSTKQIKIKLAKEGISKELIEKYVINNSEEEYEKAEKLARKYSTSVKNKSLNAIKQNILSKIVNLGYSYDAAKTAIDKLNLKNDNELEILKKEYLKAKTKYSKKYVEYDLRNHIYSYLINKGFKSDDIKSVMED